MQSTDTIQGRFKLWRQRFGHSLREVQEAVNAHLPEERRISVGTVSNYETSSMAPPRSDFVAALKEAYPDLNTTWLLTGEEEMTVIQDVVARAMELGAIPGRVRLPVDAAARNALVGAWGALVEAYGGAPGEMAEGSSTVSGYAWSQVQEAVVAPLHQLKAFVDPSDGEALNDFVASVAMAIRRYARDTGRRRERKEED